MKTLMWRAFLSTAMVLGVCSLAQADQRGNQLQREIAARGGRFTATGFNIVAGVAQPKAIIEVIEFNGDGTLSVGPVTVSVNGAIVRPAPGGLERIQSSRTVREQSRSTVQPSTRSSRATARPCP